MEKEPSGWIVACWVPPSKLTETDSPARACVPAAMVPEKVALGGAVDDRRVGQAGEDRLGLVGQAEADRVWTPAVSP